MSQIDELIRQRCPHGVSLKPLADVGTILRGRRFVKSDIVDTGMPCIHYGEIYTKYGVSASESFSFLNPEQASKLRSARHGDVIIASAGETIEDIGKAVAWLGKEDVVIHDACYAFRSPLDSKYVAYFLQTDVFREQARPLISSSKISSISTDNLGKIRIPVPPVEIQREIVRLLDRFSALEEELGSTLEAEAKARQSQQAHYRIQVLGHAEPSTDDERSIPLAELVDFINGKPQERLVSPDGSIALLTARFISTAGKFTRWVNLEDALSPARRGDIAMVMSDLPNGRALARCWYVEKDGKSSANQRVCLLRVRDERATSSRWLYHFLDRNPQLLAYDNGQDQTHLKKGQILRTRVPTVPLSEQEHATAILDQLHASSRDLVSSLQLERQARRKQYEHFRGRLLTFKGLVA